MSTSREGSLPTSSDGLRTILRSQYHAALTMLREPIERCPDDLWYSDEWTNAFWQIAYHTLFYSHLYLQPNEAAFRAWERHQSDVQHQDGIAGPPDPASTLPLIPNPYSKADALAYWEECDGMVDAAMTMLDIDSGESGFSWYPISKLEHQFVNIRHIQHHAAQLGDRLRAATDTGIAWVSTGPHD